MFLARRAGRLAGLSRIGGLFALVLALLLPAVGCSGGGGSKTNPNGTPAGSYTYNVTATGGGQNHTTAVTLNVQ